MRRYFWLVLSLLLILTACTDTTSANPATTQQATPVTIMATGSFKEYPLPQTKSGLMRPAMDSQGRLWFGEMNRNYLGSFDPQTATFQQKTPPDGQSGIMGIVAAPDNTIWFAEQYANYIGHYFPATDSYKVYPLSTISQPDPNDASKSVTLTSAPNDLVLDKRGILWFTEMNASAIGSLNTADGSLHEYPLSSDKHAASLNPYGITSDPQGQIWFTSASSKFGRLNPLTGQISYFTPPGVTSPLMEIASDRQGEIWATTFTSSQLIHFVPQTGQFTVYNTPGLPSSSGAIYGLTIAANGDVWLAQTSANLLTRLEVRTQHFFSYTIPTANSEPFGLVEGNNGNIWFTATGSNKIGMLEP